MRQHPCSNPRSLTVFLAASLAAMVLFPTASHAATFRHQVNPALQSAEPDVSNLTPSPDGTRVYFTTDFVEDVSPEWYWVPSAGGAATLLAQTGPSYEVRITSDGAYLVGDAGNGLHSLSTATGTDTVLIDPAGFLGDWDISADGQWVAYELDDALYVVAVGGGTAVEVTPAPGSNPYLESWEFLPDSSAVVFLWSPESILEERLYAYPLPLGSGSRVELSDSAGDYINEYAVAPDSSRVAYYQDDEVHSIKPDGTSRITISDTATSVADLIVSPDSTSVYWHEPSYDEFHATSLTSNTDASLITGGTINPAFFCQLGITPDGSQLIFVGEDGTRTDLYSLSTAGGTPVLISDASLGTPEPEIVHGRTSYLILPNSVRILYLCDEDNSGTLDLMSGRIDGTGSVRLDRDSLGGSEWELSYSVTFSQGIAHVLSDSSYVIYSRDEVVSGRTEVFAIHPNGVGRTKLNSTLATDADAASVSYADDDSFLVYAGDHNGDGGSEPWVVPIPGFAPTQLVDLADKLLGAGRIHVPEDGGNLFYSAYQETPNNAELYTVDYQGGTPVKVNSALPAGNHFATNFEAAPGAADVVYDLYDYGYGYRSYRGASDGSGSSLMVENYSGTRQFTADGSTVVFMAESPTVSTENVIYRQYFAGGPSVQISPALLDVESFALSPDGSTVVMLASSVGYVTELYSMPIGGGIPVKLNPALATGGYVRDFAITPDSSKVVFNADAITAGSHMLLSAPIGGGSSSVLVPSSGSSYILQLAITPDGANVVFSGDFDAAGVYEIHSVPTAGGATVKLNPALVAGGDVDFYEDFQITSDSARVIYFADGDTDEVLELYSAKIDGSSTVKLNGPLVAGGAVSSFQISADGSWVAYYADQNADFTYELFHVATTGGTVARLHPAYSSSRDVSYDYQIIGSDHVVFRADHGGPDDQIRLFCTKVPDFITNRLDNNSLSAGDVSSFEAGDDGAYVAYLADQTTDGSNDVHVVFGVPDLTPIPNSVGLMNVPLGPLPFTVSDLETPAANLTLSADSSNHALLLDGAITIGGSGSSRGLTLVPNAGQWGLTSVTVTVSDGVHEAQMSFEVRIIPDPNDPPTGVNLGPNGVPENAPVGTPVGILNTLDFDPWDIHTYTLVGGATTEFTIVGNQLLTNNVFDYETATSYNIVVRSTDFAGAFWNQNITVNVIDLAGKPEDFNRVGPMNQRFILNDTEFLSNFVIMDGPALERIRFDTVPTNGQLVLRFPEELIDGGLTGPRSLVAGDMNGDTRVDIVAAGSSGGIHILAWYENVAGVPRFPVPAGRHVIDSGGMIGQINDVAAADLDHDGDLDLVVSCGAPNNNVFLYQNMGGAPPVFARTVLTAAANNPVSVCVGKIDGDPELDIVVASSGDSTVRVYRRNNLPGLFYHPVDIASAAEPGVSEIALADFNKDGMPDIACADPTSGEAVWLRNDGGMPPVFTRKVASAVLAGSSGLALGDINKDGNIDIVVASQTANRIDWLQNDGNPAPAFIQQVLAPAFNVPSSITVRDLDGDLDQDLVATSATDGRVVLLENNGAPAPGFMELAIDRDCAGASCVLAADLDGDGKPDLASGANTSNDLSWYPNSAVMAAGSEVDIDEAQKLFYQPNPGFVGIDTFDWSGHDGVQWSFDSATVTFSVYGNEYWNWLVSNFTLPVVLDPAQRATVWGSSTDADDDGANNITEYALNGDPNDASDLPALTVEILPDTGFDYLFASYPFRKNEVNLTYTLEVSTDLDIWNSGGGYVSHVTPDTVIDAFFDQVTYKVLTDVASEPSQFVRLRIAWALD